MTSNREPLPQLGAELFLTDGGIETTLIFDDGLDLPDFASFHLLSDGDGTDALRRYFRTYVELAVRDRVGIVLETPTWRASPDWGARLGYTTEALADVNRRAVELVDAIRSETTEVPIVVSGCVGPRGDGYVVSEAMSVDEARRYHHLQIETFAGTAADMIGAITMTSPEEAAGIALAAKDVGLPVALAFTVETDGTLPTGESLAHAIEAVDELTGGYPAYYMISCAHPSHFESVLDPEAAWTSRIRGLRANASTRSHAELDEAEDLDAGDPNQLAADYASLRRMLPQITVVGGCCGTNHVHVGAISRACRTQAVT